MSLRLRKCSRCHSKKLEQHFGINTKGEIQKTCKQCRGKRQNKNSLITKEEMEIAFARSQFINDILESGNGNVEYIGLVDPTGFPLPEGKFAELTGDEIAVEWHLFNMINGNISLSHRLRLKTVIHKL